MQVDSQKAKKALAVFRETLLELVGTAYDILNANDDEEAFERAKAYLELMDAIKEEE